MLTPDAEDALLYTRSFEDETTLVAVNVRDRSVQVPVPTAYRNRAWTNAFTGTAVSADTLDLGPYGYRLLHAE
jgi:hypothetical protein